MNKQVNLFSTLNKGAGGVSLTIFVTDSRLISIFKIKYSDVHFLSFRPEIPFLVNFVQKIKIISLSRNVIPAISGEIIDTRYIFIKMS